MSEPVFARVEELFHAAIALPPERRAAYLDDACNDDAELRAAVDELLRFDDAPTQLDGFLVSPVGPVADRLRGDATDAIVRRPVVGPLPTIPGYEILGILGSGGMGVVYKARQRSLGRVVALKMLSSVGLATSEQLDRFRNEAIILARLQLPNIVPIYDVGESDGRPFFTMEFIDGPSLANILSGHPQDVAESTRLIEDLARTMHAVHQCGVVHRDLKPANVLLSGVGRHEPGATAVDSLARDSHFMTPKITDFGVAKDWTSDRNLTQTGVAVGTPRYMAPEQAGSRYGPIGPAADIYALGSMLYELLTGRTPFDAGTSAETIAQLLRDEPLSPMALRPNLARDIVTICMKCLEKSPARRYASAQALADDLHRFRVGEPIHARSAGVIERTYRWCRRRPLVAGLAAFSGLLSIAFLVTVLVYNSRLKAALARDEQQIVQLNVNIGVVALDSGDNFAAALRFAEALMHARGSPEQERDYRDRIVAALRGSPRLARLQIYDNRILCVGESAHDVYLASIDRDGIVEVWDTVANRRLGLPVKLRKPPVAGAISTNGLHLAIIDTDGRVSVYDVLAGIGHDLPEMAKAIRVAFHPDAAVLAVQYADGSVQPWDATKAPPVAIGPSTPGTLSEDGRWVVAFDSTGVGRVVDVTAQRRSVDLAAGPGLKTSAISRDGRRIALVDSENSVRVWDVAEARWMGHALGTRHKADQTLFSPDGDFVATVENGTIVRLWRTTGDFVSAWANHNETITQARFSADGTRLLLCDGGGGVRVWDAMTGRPVTPRLRHDGPLATAAFHSDGRQVIAVSRAGLARLWTPATEEPIPSTVDELITLTEVLAGGRINENQGVQTFAAAELRAAWDHLAAIRAK